MKKKKFLLALMGAIALTGAVGLTGCTDKDELAADVNPGYNAQTGEVTTDFVFNVSRAVSSTTRMTAANTQADLGQTFRGIEDAYLMSVKLGTANDGNVVTKTSDYSTTTGEGEGATTTYNSKLFNMGNILSSGDIAQTATETSITGTSHRIIELSLPTESNALLFWGKAVKSTADGADHEQGKITMNIPEDMNLDNVSFRLNRVVPNDEDEPTNAFRRAAFLQYEEMMAAVMTIIIRSEATWTEGEVTKKLAWVDYVEEVTESGTTKLQQKEKDPGCPLTPQHNMSMLGEILADAYCTFNTIYANELRAGSGSAIAHMVNDLYTVINKVAGATPLNDEETNAVKVATAIKNNIDEFFSNGSWKAPNTIKEKCGIAVANLNLIQTSGTEATATGKYAIQKFPEYFHLPDGATILQFVKDTYTAEEAAAYNATLEGALNATDPLTADNATAYNTAMSASKSEGDVLSTTEATDYNATLTGKVAEGDNKKNDRGSNIYKYQYMGSVPTYAMGGAATSGSSGSASFDPRNYMYPPELCYFGNSPIRVSNDTHIASDYPDGPQSWTTASSWTSGTIAGTTGWVTPGHVLSTTRSVAMRDNINYGTALLETTIKYGTDKLEDNNQAIQLRNTGANEDNNIINVSAGANLFSLTGILVGGQHPIVGWNYLPVISTTEGAVNYGAMVYDRLGTNAKAIPQADASTETTPSAGGSATGSVYTLVWDNWEEANKDKDQRVVYLALEFLNNSGKDFWGQNNLIRNGEKFYLTAKLDPNAAVTDVKPTGDAATAEALATYYSKGITWPTDNYALPPYNTDGSTIKQRRVFIQDYKTVANLKFNATSLQHALVAMPDLRSAQISLGLSVDLSWSKGLTFNDVVLGEE